MSSQVQAFDFSQLPRISLAEQSLQNVVARFLPEEQTRYQFILLLEQKLQQLIRGGCTFHPRPLVIEPAASWCSRLRSTGFYTILSTVPTAPKLVIVWDPILVIALIDRVLGGELTEVPKARSLTQIETGVFSFVLMKLLQALHGFFATETLPLRIEQIHASMEDVQAALGSSTHLVRSDITIAIPELTSELQLVASDRFIQETLAPRLPTSPAPVTEQEQARRWSVLGTLPVAWQVLAGNVQLLPQELENLQTGDIILLDQSYSHIRAGQLGGQALLKTDHAHLSAWEGELVIAGTSTQLRVKQVVA